MKSYQGKRPQLGKNVYIDESAILIGDIKIAKDVSIWPLVVIRGDVNHICIGARSNIQDGSVLHVTRKKAELPEGFPLLIGNDVTIGHKAMLHGCTIKDSVLVGMGAIILDGAIVDENVIIAAGSLVPQNKKLQSGYLYMGSPVKPIRKLTNKEMYFLKQSADNYVLLKNQYLEEKQLLDINNES